MIAAGKAVGGAVGRTLSRGKSKKEEEDLLKLIGALDGAISPRTI